MWRSDTFGRLLKAGIASLAYCEGKTAPAIEEELGRHIGVSGHTIQRYKAGHVPSEARIVQILAEACVMRGLLGRLWAQRFLNAARYPAIDQLLETLCPAPAIAPAAPRVLHNLPAPTYSRFIMRTRAYAEVIEGLRHRAPLVVITSLGGMGKTSLAREVAARCLQGVDDIPPFDAVVWVSDKDRPGTTNLSVVLDEVARTLDYPGFLQFAFDEKRREVEQLLRRRRILPVVDSLETVTDEALLSWLLRLPEPSKAIATSREQRRALRDAWLVELDGMSPDEAAELIAERARALKIDRLLRDPAQLEPLIAAAGGNPKALELVLGLIKYEHRPLAQVLADLEAAQGTIFDELFARSWELLDAAAQQVLLALSIFPAGAAGDALSATAGVSGTAFARALERLHALALIDVQQADLQSLPRYTLHPLVRTFAEARLHDRPEFAGATRERWAAWYEQLAAHVGFCWFDLRRLDLLDDEHETMYDAIAWAFGQERYAQTIALVEGVRYYYNVRGLWDERLSINLLRAEAAHQLGDASNEVLALSHQAEILSKQGQLDEALRFLAQAEAAADGAVLNDDAAFELGHARGLVARACGDLPRAERLWRELLPFAAHLGGQKYVINRRWLATCLAEQGRTAEARRLYEESLADAEAINDQRSVSGNALKLARLALDDGDLDHAAALITRCRDTATRHKDRRRIAEAELLSARLHAARGDTGAAHAALEAAADLFERMGMRQEMEQARREVGR